MLFNCGPKKWVDRRRRHRCHGHACPKALERNKQMFPLREVNHKFICMCEWSKQTTVTTNAERILCTIWLNLFSWNGFHRVVFVNCSGNWDVISEDGIRDDVWIVLRPNHSRAALLQSLQSETLTSFNVKKKRVIWSFSRCTSCHDSHRCD